VSEIEQGLWIAPKLGFHMRQGQRRGRGEEERVGRWRGGRGNRLALPWTALARCGLCEGIFEWNAESLSLSPSLNKLRVSLSLRVS
jgi:hypothetical protein